MESNDLALNIARSLARNRNGSQDVVDIFGSVMNPSPEHPEKWRKMIGILDEMKRCGLVQMSKHHHGHREIVLYQLTAKGWITARRGEQADESRR